MPPEDELIVEEPVEIPAEPIETPLEPAPLTEAERLEIARQYVQSNPDEFSHYYTTPAPQQATPTQAQPVLLEDPTAEITDEYGNVDGKKLSAFLAKRDKENTATIMQGMTGLLSPVLQGFAVQSATQGLPEAAVPFLHDIAKELGVNIYEAASKPETMGHIRDIAIGKAYRAGKLNVTMPEGAEPVGGRSSGSSLNAVQRQNLADLVRIRGSAVSSKEAEDLRASGALG